MTGTRCIRINGDFCQLDEDLAGLSALKIHKTTIELDDLKFNYHHPKQFFSAANGQLYIVLVNEYLRKRDIAKSVFLIYDYDVHDFGLCVSSSATFRELNKIVTDLNKLENDDPIKAAEYINLETPRVIEIQGCEFGKAIFNGCIIHPL